MKYVKVDIILPPSPRRLEEWIKKVNELDKKYTGVYFNIRIEG